MASRLSSTFVRGFRHFARCQAAESGMTSNPGGSFAGVTMPMPGMHLLQEDDMRLMGAVVNRSMGELGDTKHHRAIMYQKADVNGVNISYAKTGSGNSPVLLLPGALGSAKTDFGPQMEGLNKDLFTLIAWDPRGYGTSQDVPRDWSNHFLERDAHDAAMLMKALNYEHYSLVGWSDGGITALIMAAKYPHRIRKCITLGANAYITKEEVAMYDGFRDISQWSARMRDPFIEVYGEQRFQEFWSEWIDWFCTYYHDHEGDICKGVLKDVTCPTLVIQGMKDKLVSPTHADYLTKNIKNSRLVQVEDGAHNLHLKFAKAFNSLVENFLLEPIPKNPLPSSPSVPEQ